jgi:hypothetical protein
MTQTPAHDWMRPRLIALLADAERAGVPRDVGVAVLTDLLESPAFNGAPSLPGRVAGC